MDFDFTEEQLMLKESIDRFLRDAYGFEQRQTYLRDPHGWSRRVWTTLGQMGFLSLGFSEEDGGLGGGPVEQSIVLEALGRVIYLEPFLSSTIVAGTVLRHGSDEQKQAFIPQMISGETLFAFAHDEPDVLYGLSSVSTTAVRHSDGWVLEGTKSGVLHGNSADYLVVSAREKGNRFDDDGVSLFIVPGNATGVRRRPTVAHDGMQGADCILHQVKVAGNALIGRRGHGIELVERAEQAAIAGLASEAVGLMEAIVSLTVDHLKVRNQFGRPIGEFQALQHKAADMLVTLEQSRSMAIYANAMTQSPDPFERRIAFSAAKVFIGQAVRAVAQAGIQLHGGLGFSEDYPIGHCFKRATAIEMRFGDTDHHLKRFAALGGFIAPSAAAL